MREKIAISLYLWCKTAPEQACGTPLHTRVCTRSVHEDIAVTPYVSTAFAPVRPQPCAPQHRGWCDGLRASGAPGRGIDGIGGACTRGVRHSFSMHPDKADTRRRTEMPLEFRARVSVQRAAVASWHPERNSGFQGISQLAWLRAWRVSSFHTGRSGNSCRCRARVKSLAWTLLLAGVS